jgi:hypothetical protein
VAVVANPDMQQTEQSVGTFAKGNPGITVTFDTLPEDQERAEISLPATPFSSLRRFIHEFVPVQAPHARGSRRRGRSAGDGRLFERRQQNCQ